MEMNRRLRLQLLAQNGIFVVLMLALVMLVAHAAREYRKEWDVTRNARNTLSQGTQDVLKQIEGPLAVTAYAVSQDAGGANVHKIVRDRLLPYQRVKPDIQLTLVDPREQPKLAQAAKIRSPNELVISHRGRTEHVPLAEFNEQAFANALMRITRASSNVLFWLEGHGERKLDGIANHDLGEFGRQLQAKGIRFNSVNLALAQEVPANASMLLIASPQVDLQAGEVQKIRRHLERGGNLLWLIDPEPLRGLNPIAEVLGLVLSPGTVVDLTLRPRAGPPAFAVATQYGRHPVTGGFQLNTLFPHARQIGTVDSEEWRATPLIEVAQRGWVETGKLDEKVAFDKARDVPGPITIATALERTVGDRQQRVIVVGTGQFLANSYLGNAGNLQLGLAMVNWLTGEDKLVTIQPRPASDTSLDLDRTTLHLIALTFLLVLPMTFAIGGGLIWWRRRKVA